jgi:carbamoyl-phosphate synthase large subunit
VPFVAKAIGVPVAKIAARVMAGERLAGFGLAAPRNGHIAVKEAVFPFARFPGVDLILGPEMKSTGEVMGLDRDFAAAFVKSQLGAGTELPREGRVFVSVRERDKAAAVGLARRLHELGFEVAATRGTAAAIAAAGLPVTLVKKVHEGRPHIVDMIKNGEIAMLINTTEGQQAIRDSYALRRAALMARLPYYTTLPGARAVVQALPRVIKGELEVASLQSYFEASH